MYQWKVWYFNDKINGLCSCVFNFVNTKQTEHSLYGYHICVHCILLQYYSPKPCEANMWGSVSIKQVFPKIYFQIISIYILHIKTVVSTGIFLKENVSVTSTLYIIYVCVSKQSNCCIKGIINIKNNTMYGNMGSYRIYFQLRKNSCLKYCSVWHPCIHAHLE